MTEVGRFDRASEFEHTLFDKKKTQKQMCLEYLEEYGSITPLEALSAFGSFRLSALIFELREDGYVIRTDLNDEPNQARYAIYTLIREGEEYDG